MLWTWPRRAPGVGCLRHDPRHGPGVGHIDYETENGRQPQNNLESERSSSAGAGSSGDIGSAVEIRIVHVVAVGEAGRTAGVADSPQSCRWRTGRRNHAAVGAFGVHEVAVVEAGGAGMMADVAVAADTAGNTNCCSCTAAVGRCYSHMLSLPAAELERSVSWCWQMMGYRMMGHAMDAGNLSTPKTADTQWVGGVDRNAVAGGSWCSAGKVALVAGHFA